jgi:hypothetical protein
MGRGRLASDRVDRELAAIDQSQHSGRCPARGGGDLLDPDNHLSADRCDRNVGRIEALGRRGERRKVGGDHADESPVIRLLIADWRKRGEALEEVLMEQNLHCSLRASISALIKP